MKATRPGHLSTKREKDAYSPEGKQESATWFSGKEKLLRPLPSGQGKLIMRRLLSLTCVGGEPEGGAFRRPVIKLISCFSAPERGNDSYKGLP